MWTAPDLTEEDLTQIQTIVADLGGILVTKTVLFHTREDIENLTEDQALTCMRYARRMLMMDLLRQEYHEHFCDDCGDYLDASTELWHDIFYDCQLQEGSVDIESMKKILLSDARACDGDFRYDAFSEELQAELWNI